MSSIPSFQLSLPAPHLRKLINNYWAIDARVITSYREEHLMRIEGGSGWILMLDGTLEFDTGRCTHGAMFDASTGASNHLLGMDQPLAIGIRFKPGAQALFSQISANEYRRDHVLLSDAGIKVDQVLLALKQELNWKEQASILDRWLTDLLSPPKGDAHAVSALANLIFRHSYSVPFNVAKLCQVSGWSERKLQRKFNAMIGMSPYRLVKVARANQAYSSIKLLGEIDMNLSDIAVHHGYFDHPHMTHDFKELFGVLPSSLINKR